MATVVATGHNPVIEQFYGRRVDSEESKKVALVACMRKLLTTLNVMLSKEEEWDPKYNSVNPCL